MSCWRAQGLTGALIPAEMPSGWVLPKLLKVLGMWGQAETWHKAQK